MPFSKNTKNIFVLILIPVVLLIISAFITSSTNKNDLVELLSESNSFFPELPKKYIKQYNNSIEKDTATIYSYKFVETKLERKLILIKKKPTSREFANQIIVYLYPNNLDSFKNASNFLASKKCLDYSTKTKPIMYNYNNDNYSVREINLPFIDVEKFFVIQHGVWKKTIINPFANNIVIDTNTTTPSISSLSEFYFSVFQDILTKHDIKHLPINKKVFEESATTSNIKIIKITNKNSFWDFISSKKEDYKTVIKPFNDPQNEITNLISSYLENKVEFEAVFDIEKLANYFTLINLFSNNASKEMGLLLNNDTRKLEPFYLNTNKLGELNTYLKEENISNIAFLNSYVKALKNLNFEDFGDLFNEDSRFLNELKVLNQTNPEIIFNPNVLFHNSLVIKKSINPSTGLKAEFLDITNTTLTVSVKNLSIFPIKLLDLNYKKNKKISSNISNRLILKNEKDTIVFNLPRSFENLFVHKKTKITGFIFEKNIFDLKLSYQLAGLNSVYFTDIIPYQPTQDYNKSEDLFRQKPNLTNTSYLTINTTNKTINLIKDFTLKMPLILPKNYTVIAKPGITINIEKGGKIISYSPFKFIGEKENPIRFISKDKQGEGILVLCQGEASTLKYVEFDWLTNPTHGMWSTTSAVTFYESPVTLDYVKISNNTCEDALNIVRTTFTMTNTLFSNTQSDAFDGDYVTGTINSCVFKDLGNDAIDVSGSDLNIYNVKIFRAGDKALSAGENSQMKIEKVVITNCEIALAGKDLSIVSVKNLTIKNTKLGFTAFQKKPEFGPSKITANTIVMDNVETSYLIENTSSLTIDGKKIKTDLADVKSKMYGVEFGVSSDETRNKKTN
jgi:hypothetical protein